MCRFYKKKERSLHDSFVVLMMRHACELDHNRITRCYLGRMLPLSNVRLPHLILHTCMLPLVNLWKMSTTIISHLKHTYFYHKTLYNWNLVYVGCVIMFYTYEYFLCFYYFTTQHKKM